MARFDGKVVLVTGGGHGIGRATASRFAEEGASVFIADRNGETAQETKELIDRAGGLGFAAEVDIADEHAIGGLVERIAHVHGRLDIVHNNAGRLTSASIVDLSTEEWDLTFAVNIRAMFLVCRASIPLMLRQGGGVIVNTASTSAFVGEASIPAYSASKAAVVNFTRQLAADYARRGIRANCVCPGWIPTGFNDPVLVGLSDAEVQLMVEATVPVGRQGMPEEIAAAVAFLASDDASYIAGHALVVDGGFIACR
jgi:meso-butanediol dehydrogenase/(S,S)-butanediol dehydrogenase/diacetyl reductase